jgi:hypothetical protein
MFGTAVDPPFGAPHPPTAGFSTTTLPYVPPPRPARGKRWLVAAVAAGTTLALVGAIAVTRGRHASLPEAGAGAPPFDLVAAGYSTFEGPRGLPMAVGSPWGTACAPVVLTLDVDAPLEMVAAASEVASEADGDGLNVVFGDSMGTYDVSHLRNVAPDGTGVHPITVRVSNAAPPKLATGKPRIDTIGWSASLAADGRHERLTKIVVTIYARAVARNEVLARGAMRDAVAWSMGVAGSANVGSGLYSDRAHRADLFTDNDVAALRAMSGCG